MISNCDAKRAYTSWLYFMGSPMWRTLSLAISIDWNLCQLGWILSGEVDEDYGMIYIVRIFIQ